MSTTTTTTSPPPYIVIFLSILLLILPLASAADSHSQSKLYADHCRHTVPDSPVTDFLQSDSKFLQITKAFYTGGDPILLLSNRSDSSSDLFTFTTFGVRNTRLSDVVQFEATMYFRNRRRRSGFHRGGELNGKRRRLTGFRIRGPKVPVTLGGGGLSFNLHGFWSARSGAGCAVGSGMSRSDEGTLVSHSVVFRFRYLNSSTIESSLVNGVVESLDDETSPAFFKPIHMIGISEMGYNYTLIENISEDWGGTDVVDPVSGTDVDIGFRKLSRRFGTDLNLVYESDCISRNCNPLGASAGDLPGIVNILPFKLEQTGERARLVIKFYSSGTGFEHRSLLPEVSLVGEGAWDRKTNQLHIAACRIMNHTNSLVNASVGDCSIRLILMFPSVFSLRNRSSIVGDIWSTSNVNNSSYFDKIGLFSSWKDPIRRTSLIESAKYEYTVVDTVKSSCSVGKIGKRDEMYPNVYSTDMYLHLQMKSKKNGGGSVTGSPFSVGDHVVQHRVGSFVGATNSSIVNIGYGLHFRPMNMKFSDLNMDGIDVSAEGTYDTTTGTLCMVGCLLLRSSDGKLWRNSTLECETRINIQFPPLDADAKHHVKGTIVSTRASTDPRYFEPIKLSSRSIYTNVAEESIWRMDIEITLVLISKTLACVFVGLQLYYCRKWPETPPFISILMLVVLTLGHMIPLLLNFEAIFVNRDKSNVSLDSGGWLAVNEVIVRIVTMVAFLLQFRLLQLTCSCRLADAKSKGLWESEMRVIYSSLPVYIAGMLIAWFSHRQNPVQMNTTLVVPPISFQHYQIHNPVPIHNQLSSFWGSLKAYGGLVHDSFLLPQILFNMFHNSQEKALAYSFYIGTTFLRVLPHLYDLYRDHQGYDLSTLRLFYANHILDFYTSAWNIIISCLGLLFAAVIFSQQRFGGRCILPRRFNQTCEYEKVAVVNCEQQ